MDRQLGAYLWLSGWNTAVFGTVALHSGVFMARQQIIRVFWVHFKRFVVLQRHGRIRMLIVPRMWKHAIDPIDSVSICYISNVSPLR